jgi:hypothetical protein
MGYRLLRRRAAGKKGALLLGRLVDEQSSVVRRLSRGRAEEVGFGRFLGNDKVSVEAIFAAEASGLAERVAGLEVLAIQDSSELSFGRRSGARRGMGPVAFGAGRGLLVHPVLVLDAQSQAVLGLAHGQVWTREKPARAAYQAQPIEEKESYRWLAGGAAAKAALAKARRITLIADRESDIYEAWARLPDERCRLLARACRDRLLATGGRLFQAAEAWPVAERFDLELPSAPGRPERLARLALRFGTVEIKRPKNCSDKQAPRQLRLALVEVLEEAPPAGCEPLHWRLLVSHPVESAEAARAIVELYRQRWHIEQLFRSLKSQGLDIEASQIDSAEALVKMVALALIAAAKVVQLVQGRRASPRPATDVIAPDQLPLVDRLQHKLEGRTQAQKNPHPRGSLPWLSWVIARLGGWKGYASERPPGPITMHHGWTRFQTYLDAWSLLQDV